MKPEVAIGWLGMAIFTAWLGVMPVLAACGLVDWTVAGTGAGIAFALLVLVVIWDNL